MAQKKKSKKPVHHVEMTEGKRAIIQQLLQEYDIQSAQDIQEALKDLLGGTTKEMMEAEMEEHLGYSRSERTDRSNLDDYRHGTSGAAFRQFWRCVFRRTGVETKDFHVGSPDADRCFLDHDHSSQNL